MTNGWRLEVVLLGGVLAIAAALLRPAQLHAEESNDPVGPSAMSSKTDWMFKAKVGLSTHYIAGKNSLDKYANQFQVKNVADQVERSGAGWFLFTLHHQPWAMLAPNASYDRLLGNSDYTAKRDVPLDLITALTPKGVKLMLYVNLRLDPHSACPAEVRERMGGWPPNDKLIDNVAVVYREFSMRYGDRVAGWWVDGAFLGAYRDSPHKEKWFATIAEALRAGNSQAIVAFNPGLKGTATRYSRQNDYTAGEMDDIGFVPKSRWIDGAQCHLWTFLGEFWGLSGVRFDDRTISDYAKRVTANGGVLTFEVGTKGVVERKAPGGSDPNSSLGTIDPRQIRQVALVTKAIREATKNERSSTPNPPDTGDGK